MKKFIVIFSLVVFLPMLIFSQSLSGKVQDVNGNALPGVNLLLLKQRDSAVVKGAASDKNGRFNIEKIKPGTYVLSASGVSFRSNYSTVTVREKSALEIPLITLAQETASLTAVEVTGKKPLIEQRIDRTIVNVAGSIIGNGSTALDILRNTPGITLDQQNDLLSLRGKQGVIVQIDGRQTYLPAEQVVAMLRNMPGSNIERIEIITNPSAKYDAAGNAGIIDIRLKKNNNYGTNGSVTLSAGSGEYDRERGSFQINHKNNRLNLFGNYAGNDGGDIWRFRLGRVMTTDGVKTYISQVSPIKMRNTGHNAKAGLDFKLSPSTSVGLLWTGFWTKRKEDGIAISSFADKEDAGPYFETFTDKKIRNRISNQLGNFNIQHTLKNNRGQIAADVNVGGFARNFLNELQTNTTIPANSGDPATALKSLMPVGIDIFTANADYNRTYKTGWNLQLGWKTSVVRSKNNMTISQGEVGNLKIDSALSNRFIYKETIHAAYINLSGKLDAKTQFQSGLRAEETISDANSITQQKEIKRDYLNIFPSVFVQREIANDQTLTLTYSYRINRPNYQNLNPVRSYIDPYAFSMGNSFLRPDYTHSIEVKHGYHGKLFTSLGASYVKDLVFFIVEPIDKNTSTRTPTNIGKSAEYNLSVTAPVSVVKGWDMQWTLIGYYGRYRYTYLDSLFKVANFSGRLDVTNSFIFGKGWTAELTGWVTSASVEALWHNPWQAAADLGVQKMFNSAWKLKFSLTDIFHSNQVRGETAAPKLSNHVRIDFDSRVALLTLTYNFGNQQLKNRQRQSGSEDEIKRTSSN